MKLQLEHEVRLASGGPCIVHVEYEGEGVDTDHLLQEVGRALLDQQKDHAPRTEGSGHNGSDDTPFGAAGNGAAHRDEEDPSPDEVKLHGKARNTVHKVVLALDQRAVRGTPATVDDIERGTGLSRPAIYRVLDADTPQGRYARGLLRVQKEGNAYAIDITQAGRNMASRLRTRPL